MESAGTHFDGGDCEMAVEIYSEILSRGGELTAPECAAVYNKRGLCYERVSDWDRALDDYNAAIEQLVPSEWNHHMDTSFYSLLARSHLACAGRYPIAADADSAVDQRVLARAWGLYYHRGRLLHKLRRLAEAEDGDNNLVDDDHVNKIDAEGRNDTGDNSWQ